MNGRLEQEQRSNKKVEKILMKLPNYVKDWYYSLLASDVSPASCYTYINIVKRFFIYMASINKGDVKQLVQEDIDRYFISIRTKLDGNVVKRTSDSFQLTVWFGLRSFFDFLTNRGYIAKNYVEQIHKPKNRDLDRINRDRKLLTKDDFVNIMRVVEADWNGRDLHSLIFSLFMSTGMRLSALVAINDADIDLKNRILKVMDKGDKIHEYYISDDLKEYIEEYRHFKSRDMMLREITDYDKDALFIDSEGKRLSTKSVYNIVRKYTQKALGTPVSPHKLRAGFCSILYDQTHDAEFVRRAVGHSNLATTQRYIVTDGKERQRAANIMGNILAGNADLTSEQPEYERVYAEYGLKTMEYYLHHPDEIDESDENNFDLTEWDTENNDNSFFNDDERFDL